MNFGINWNELDHDSTESDFIYWSGFHFANVRVLYFCHVLQDYFVVKRRYARKVNRIKSYLYVNDKATFIYVIS